MYFICSYMAMASFFKASSPSITISGVTAKQSKPTQVWGTCFWKQTEMMGVMGYLIPANQPSMLGGVNIRSTS